MLLYLLADTAALPRIPAAVTPLVLLPDKGRGLLSAETADYGPWLASIRTQHAGPLWVAWWCDGDRPDGLEHPERATWALWSDDAAWRGILANLARLRDACRMLGIEGVAWDAEIHPCCPPPSYSGTMRPPAWNGGARAMERGQAVGAALAGLRLGCYVDLQDALKFGGFRQFHQGAIQGAGGLMLGDEGGYTRRSYDAAGIRQRAEKVFGTKARVLRGKRLTPELAADGWQKLPGAFLWDEGRCPW
jgi:hypothetical protein